MSGSCLQMTAQNGDLLYAKDWWKENNNTLRNRRKWKNEKLNEFLFICCLFYLLYHCVWNISLSFILIYVHFTHSRPRLIAGLLLLLLWKSKIPIMLFSIQTFRGLISPILLQHIQNKNTFIQPTILFCFEYFHNFRNY